MGCATLRARVPAALALEYWSRSPTSSQRRSLVATADVRELLERSFLGRDRDRGVVLLEHGPPGAKEGVHRPRDQGVVLREGNSDSGQPVVSAPL